ncbi:hypothetical protein Tcan_04758 [Toxocara canis]|uniref:Uncharacterized protein n=1 Tax=Toxocara canis TaxID=6265 RepID=A0A0B2VBA0_TOXCA|nr:hypothetical protein Tcan_04758 [Toxocara canis]
MWLVKVFLGAIIFVRTQRAIVIFSPSRKPTCDQDEFDGGWTLLAERGGGISHFTFSGEFLIPTKNIEPVRQPIDLVGRCCHKEKNLTIVTVKKIYADKDCDDDMIVIGSCVRNFTAFVVMKCPDEETIIQPGNNISCLQYVHRTLYEIREPPLDHGQLTQGVL